MATSSPDIYAFADETPAPKSDERRTAHAAPRDGRRQTPDQPSHCVELIKKTIVRYENVILTVITFLNAALAYSKEK